MNYVLLAVLLVFCLIVLVLTYNVGYKRGATAVLNEWRAWLEEMEE